MVVRISDKTQNYSKVTKLLVKPYYLFYNLNSTTMYAICGIVLVVMILLLYIRNYKNNHYGGTNSKMIFLMHISFDPIIIDCINLNSLNKRVSLVAVILFCNFGLSGDWIAV